MEILPENGLAEAVLSLGHLVLLTLQCTISSSGGTQEHCLPSTIAHRVRIGAATNAVIPLALTV